MDHLGKPQCALGALGMVGLSFRKAHAKQIAAWSHTEAELELLLPKLKQQCGLLELVYLATCNRVEVVFVSPPGVSIERCRERIYAFFCEQAGQTLDGSQEVFFQKELSQKARQSLHAYVDEGAVEHLFMVAASLDSLTAGEAQVLGQVKAAFRRAHAAGMVGPRLSLIFDDAFSVAKKVRSQTGLGVGAVSVATLAHGAIEKHLAELSLSQNDVGTLVVVGSGPLSLQSVESFARQSRCRVNVVWVNRTISKIASVADKLGIATRSLDDFCRDPDQVDVILSATSAPKPLFDKAFISKILEKSQASRAAAPGILAVDLSVEGDVALDVASIPGCKRLGLDDLSEAASCNRATRADAIAEAREIVDQGLDAWRQKTAERLLAPWMKRLRQAQESILEDSLAELMPQLDKILNEDVNNRDGPEGVVRLWARQTMRRLGHGPMMGLKELVREHGAEPLTSFVYGWLGPEAIEEDEAAEKVYAGINR